MEDERTVIFLGTPLQFLEVVGTLVVHDGMNDPENLPPFLSDIKTVPVYLSNVSTWLSVPADKPLIDWTKPVKLNPDRQQILLERDDLGVAVTAVGMGADKSTVFIGCGIPHIWTDIEEGWNWLVSELVDRGRIETITPAQEAKRRRPKLIHGESDDLPVERRQKALRQWLKLILNGHNKRAAARLLWPEFNADSAVKKLNRWAKMWPEVVEDEKAKSVTK